MPATTPRSFARPIPASQARSRAQQIVDTNRDRIEDGVIGGGKQELVRILVHAQKQIEARFAREIARRGDETWTAADLQASLVQVRIALAQIEPKLTDLLAKNAELAKELGAKSVVDLLRYFEQETGGGLRPLSIRPALALTHPMLGRYATSVDRYGRAMIGMIARELQAGVVRGATFEEMTDMLVGKRGPRGIVSMAAKEIRAGEVVRTRTAMIEEGLFVRHRGWAERIVRTEGMRAYAEGAQEELVEQRAKNFPDLKRKLIETFDKRTGWDSYKAHGQVRGLNEPFVDGAGRVYLLPPGRPNDRAVVIPYREAWDE